MRDLSELNHVEMSQEVADEIQRMTEAIGGMARQIAAMHRNIEDSGIANSHAKVSLEFGLSTMMEVLGNLLNGLDAVEDEDIERGNAIFAELHRRFPADRDHSLQGASQAVRLISELSDRNDDATYREAVKEIVARSGFAPALASN